MTLVEPVDALLAIDVGNTRVGLAVWDGDGLHDAQRIPVGQVAEWRTSLGAAWERVGGHRRAVVVGSVNPPATAEIVAAIEEFSGLTALRVRDDLPLPMAVDVEYPDEVGVDRVCSAAAAYDRIGGACAVASFGTAITIDCVSSDGRFLGGAILPGFGLTLDALHQGTAQLPRVAVRPPGSVFGRNTRDAMVNGVVLGAVGALREIVERFATELREWPQLVLTGGDAPLVAELTDFVDAVVPDLCLMGIALAHGKAAGTR